MSFRELRNFTEMMRALGYPRLVSVENFRTPNFPLVAHCLYFLVNRYDPHVNVTDDIDTEDDRVEFVNSVCSAMRVKAGLKLNAKKLYASDGRAVRELSKIARLLYDAQRAGAAGGAAGTAGAEDDDDAGATAATLGSKAKDMKGARALASEITDRGAKLYDLLGQETELRGARESALRFLEAVSSTMSSANENSMLERQLTELDTQGTLINTTMAGANPQSVDAVDALVQEVAEEHGLDVAAAMPSAPTAAPTAAVAVAQPEPEAVTDADEDALMARLAALA